MAGGHAGSVSVEIVPDATGWAAKLRAKILPDATRVGAQFGEAFGAAASARMGASIRAGMNEGGRGAGNQGAQAGESYGSKFADTLKARLTAALRNMPDVKLDADSTDADRTIAGVRANLEAIRDRKIGIDLDADVALERIEAMRVRLDELALHDPNIHVRVDAAAASAQLAAFTAEIKRLDAQSAEAGAAAGNSLGGRFGETLRARLTAAMQSMPTLHIDANSTEADRAIAEVQAELLALHDTKIGIDISSAHAVEQVAALKLRLDALGARSPDIRVKVDTAAASAKLAAFAAEVKGIESENMFASMANGADGFGGRMLTIVSLVLTLAAAFIPMAAAGVGALASLTAGAIAAGGAFGVLLLALAPVVQAVMAVSAAHKAHAQAAKSSASSANQVASAMEGVANAHRAVTSAVQAAAQAQIASARAIKDANRSLADAVQQAARDRVGAEESVTRAQRDVSDAVKQAAQDQVEQTRKIADAQQSLVDAKQAAADDAVAQARRVSDAEQGVADATARAASDQIAAARSIVAAERTVGEAQKTALKAQRALDDARIQAARDAEDLSSQVAHGALDERDAVLNLADAQTALDRQKRNGARANPKLLAEAQLGYDKAALALSDQQTANKRLADEKAKSDAAGIEGSKAVQDAQDTLTEAQQRVVDAQVALTDATTAAAASQVASARSIADAQRALADAVAVQAERQKASARSIADAQQAVTDAATASRLSQQADARAIADANAALVKSQQAAADQQVTSARSISDAHQKVADAVAASALSQKKSAEAVANAQRGVITAQRAVQTASQSAGAAGGAAFQTMNDKLAALTPEGRNFVKFIMQKLKPALSGLSKAAQKGLLPGLQDGLTYLLPMLPGLVTFVGELSTVFGDLLRDAGKALTAPFWKQFFKFIGDQALTTLKLMGPTLGNLVKGLAGLYQGFAPVVKQFGEGFLKLSERFAKWGTTLDKNTSFQKFIAYVLESGPKTIAFFGALVKGLAGTGAALVPVGDAVLKVLTAFLSLDPNILAAIVVGIVAFTAAVKIAGIVMALYESPILLIVAGLVLLGLAFYEAYKHSEKFRDVVDAVWKYLKIAIGIAWDGIKIYFDLWKKYYTEILGPVLVWLFEKVVVPVFKGIVDAISGAWTKFIHPVFTAIKTFVTDVLGPVFKTFLQPLIELAWDAIRIAIKVAWVAIEIIFKTIEIAIKALGALWSWLYTHAVKPAWDWISKKISDVWTTGVQPVLDVIGSYIQKNIAPAFKEGVKAIGEAWNGLIEAAKAPVRFVVDTVINTGIIDTFNTVAGFFKIDPIKHVSLPKGFASGGLLSGAGSGTSDDMLARVSNGEYVVRAAAVKQLGVGFLDLINDADRHDISGDPSGMIVRKYADGGLIQQVKDFIPSVDRLPYVWGATGPGSFDCSGLAGEIWARLTGHANSRRYFTTSADFSNFGFKRGTGMFTIGVNPGHHMDGNLDGEGFEARSTATGIFTGGAAKPPSQFAQQWYLPSFGPGTGGTANSSGGGGGDSGDDGGIGIPNPVAALKKLMDGPLGKLDAITGTPYGKLVAGPPRALAVAAEDFLKNLAKNIASGAIDVGKDVVGRGIGFITGHLPGFADGGIVTYDNGGYLPPGLSTVMNGTGAPEPVLTSSQFSSMGQQGNGQRPVTVNVTNPRPETAAQSTTQIMRRLAYMQH